MSSAASCGADPARKIEAAFRQVARTRMRDLPFVNARLDVAAVGFRPWQASWIGVLVTPWGINLLQLPTPGAPFARARADAVIEIALPGAVMPFMPAHLDALGEYRLCSLFSPVQQFADQATALAAAHETLRLLFEPQTQPATGNEDGRASSARMEEQARQVQMQQTRQGAHAQSGRFSGTGREVVRKATQEKIIQGAIRESGQKAVREAAQETARKTGEKAAPASPLLQTGQSNRATTQQAPSPASSSPEKTGTPDPAQRRPLQKTSLQAAQKAVPASHLLQTGQSNRATTQQAPSPEKTGTPDPARRRLFGLRP